MATITRIIDTPSATPIDSGEHDVVTFSESGDAAGANTYAIQQAAQSASVLVHGTGDTVMIEGLSSEYTISRSGKAITLKNVTTSQVITLSFADLVKAEATDAKLVFLDGELDLTKAAGRKAIFIGDQKVVKAAKAVVTTPEHSTAASEYFDDLTGAGGANAIARTYILTTASNTITAGFNNDVIEGVFGDATDTNNTFNLGDNIDAGDGDDVLSLIATGTNPSSVAIILKGVETINVSDAVGSTINATQFSDNPAINFNNTVAGNTSTVTAASLGSVIGLNGEGDLTVNYASTAGGADNAHVSVNGAGSESNRSTIDVSDGGTVEKVTIDTTGTNYIALNAGDAAENVTVTGDGTNDIDLSTGIPEDVFTLDASTSTGTNTFDLGTNLNSIDTIKGGTGDDTIVATLDNGGMLVATMTGVETAEFTFGSVVGLNLDKTTGLETINMYDVDGATNVINADSTLAAVNILTPLSDDQDVNIEYREGHEGDLHLGLVGMNAADGPDGVDFDMGDITIENAKSFTIDVLGPNGLSADSISVMDAVDSFNINVADEAGLNFSAGFWGEVGEMNFVVGKDADLSGSITTGSNGRADIGDINLTVGASGNAAIWIGQSGGYDVGNVTISAIGEEASAAMYINVDDGASIGDVTLASEGISASVRFKAEASGGSIGDISIDVNGIGTNAYLSVSAGDAEGAGSGSSPLGSIGDVTITMDGMKSEFSGYITVSGGDLGNVSLTSHGDNATAYLYIDVVGEYRDLDDDGDDDDWFGGGNIGNIDFTMTGGDASGYLGVQSSGGDIGNITITGDGGHTDVRFNVSANYEFYSGAPGFVTVGDVTVNILNGARVSGSITVSGGSIGNVSIDVEGGDSSGRVSLNASDASGTIGLQSGYTGGGDIGNITVNIDGGTETEFEFEAVASGGDIGDVVWNQTGGNTSGDMDLSAVYQSGGALAGRGGKIGDISIALGSDLDFDGYIGAEVSIDDISLTAGHNVSAAIDVSGGWADDSSEDREISSITIDVGANNDIDFQVSGWGGDIGGVSVEAGDSTDMLVSLDNVSGDVQFVTLTGGNSFASGLIEVDANSVGFVDAGTWAGELKIDLRGTEVGSDITTGTYKTDVYGTDASDTIRLGTGIDTVHLDGITDADTVWNFNKSKDILDVNDATTLETLLTSNTVISLGNGDIQRLVDISGGESLITAAGLQAALADGGEYDDVDIDSNASAVFVTATSSSATKFYVFEAYDGNSDGDLQDTDEIVLVGIVNGSTIGNLTLANFE